VDLISILPLTRISISRSLSPGSVLRTPLDPSGQDAAASRTQPCEAIRVPRRRTHAKATRSRMVCIRMTDDDYALKAAQAKELGLTVSGLCERLVLSGKVEAGARPAYRAMDPALFTELRRIGNNVNQIAHATNSNLPTEVMYAWRTINTLLSTLLSDELLSQKISSLRTRTTEDDPPAAQARAEFQRSVRVHPARRAEDFP